MVFASLGDDGASSQSQQLQLLRDRLQQAVLRLQAGTTPSLHNPSPAPCRYGDIRELPMRLYLCSTACINQLFCMQVACFGMWHAPAKRLLPRGCRQLRCAAKPQTCPCGLRRMGLCSRCALLGHAGSSHSTCAASARSNLTKHACCCLQQLAVWQCHAIFTCAAGARGLPTGSCSCATGGTCRARIWARQCSAGLCHCKSATRASARAAAGFGTC